MRGFLNSQIRIIFFKGISKRRYVDVPRNVREELILTLYVYIHTLTQISIGNGPFILVKINQ